MIRELQADRVREEFSLFCRVALDDTLRAAVSAIPFAGLGLEDDAQRCPIELRGRKVEIRGELFDASGAVVDLVSMEMELDQFVRLRVFLARFSTAQVRAMSESMRA